MSLENEETMCLGCHSTMAQCVCTDRSDGEMSDVVAEDGLPMMEETMCMICFQAVASCTCTDV